MCLFCRLIHIQCLQMNITCFLLVSSYTLFSFSQFSHAAVYIGIPLILKPLQWTHDGWLNDIKRAMAITGDVTHVALAWFVFSHTDQTRLHSK